LSVEWDENYFWTNVNWITFNPNLWFLDLYSRTSILLRVFCLISGLFYWSNGHASSSICHTYMKQQQGMLMLSINENFWIDSDQLTKSSIRRREQNRQKNRNTLAAISPIRYGHRKVIGISSTSTAAHHRSGN